MNRIHTHQATSLFFLLVLFLVTGCSGDSPKTTERVSDTPPAITPPPQTDTTTSTGEDTTATPPERPAEETGEVAPLDTRQPSPVVSGTRSVDEDRLAVILDLISQDLEAQKLAYVSELGQDCSGIYHKIKDQLQRKMSVLGDQSKYHYPSFSADRNSRQIADWYYRNGNLHIVQDGMADRNRIRPGSVMFYGRTEEKYSNLSIDLLTNPGKFIHDGTNGKIMHVAVVTRVIRDEDGKVTNYTIMHGRNSRHTASRTSGNHEGSGFDKAHAKFPFGNWNQQWVAVANIETPK